MHGLSENVRFLGPFELSGLLDRRFAARSPVRRKSGKTPECDEKMPGDRTVIFFIGVVTPFDLAYVNLATFLYS